MKNVEFLNDLKLRASYGSAGDDNVGNFKYLSGYNISENYLIGGNVVQGIRSTGLANPLLTWEKMKIYNAGLNWSMWGRKFYGETDVFYRERTGIPATRQRSLPSTFGATLPEENLESLNNRGFEFMAGTAGGFGELFYDLSANISWSRAKWKYREEAEYTDSDEIRLYKQSGKWTDVQYGYVSDGLFTSQAEIDALGYDQDGRGNESLRPGDIKYLDVNGDGKIDWRDQVNIGKGTYPNWMYGINLNLYYRNFDITALFQGAFGYYTNIVLTRGTLVYPEEVYKLRWTEDNNDRNALVPRLGGAATNGYTSDFWYKKAGYLRLKILSVGYNLPSKVLSKIKVEKARVYVSGTNLLTFDRLNKYGVDPEAPSGQAGFYYPQMKTISFGVNISF